MTALATGVLAGHDLTAPLDHVGGILPPLLQATTETSLEEFRWLSLPPAWVLFLVILPLVVLFVHWIYQREPISAGGARWPRWVMLGVRVLVILAVIALLGEPILRRTTFLKQDSVILVLVDDSLSMGIKDQYTDAQLLDQLARFFKSSATTIEDTMRYDLIRRLFMDEELSFLHELRKKGNVVVLSFAGGVQRVKRFARWTPELIESAEASAAALDVLPDYSEVRVQTRVQQTRIADAIIDSIARIRGRSLSGRAQPIAGVVLLTDGQQTAGNRPIDEVARQLGKRRIPVFAVAVGNPDEPKDIRMVHLDVDSVVLAGDKVPFDVVFSSEGFAGETVRVRLSFDEEVVASENVVLEGGGKQQSLRMEYRPPSPGDYLVTVEIEELVGELFSENNSISKPVKVLDQKIRVLYVEGPPRWEYRYLKNALIRDPTMQTQVFLFSADTDFIQESSPGVLPLRRFPISREELFKYHVIVIGDVPLHGEENRYLTAEAQELIKTFVYEAGGGVVFIAGQNANPFQYVGAEIYSLLPIEVPERSRFSIDDLNEPVTEAFNVVLTPAGREHKVLRLASDAETNLQLWENRDGRPLNHLPGFYWFADVGPPKKGAVVLAHHPTKRRAEDNKPSVILAFMNYGKGRTFFSAVDNTWRWRAGVDNRYFYRLWGQVLRFCATGRLLGKTPRYAIETDKSNYTLGETVNVVARVYDANMKPSANPTVTVYHRLRGRGDEAPEAIELRLNPLRGQGTYLGAILADRLGVHDVWLGTPEERFAFRSYEVAVPPLEMRDPRRNQALLEELAAGSGGAALELFEVAEINKRLEGVERSQQGSVEDEPLWDEFWVLAAFTSLIAVEWILRKTAKLL